MAHKPHTTSHPGARPVALLKLRPPGLHKERSGELRVIQQSNGPARMFGLWPQRVGQIRMARRDLLAVTARQPNPSRAHHLTALPQSLRLGLGLGLGAAAATASAAATRRKHVVF